VTKDPCRGCNDCCRDLAIYADPEDAQAEPRIAAAAQWDADKRKWRLCPTQRKDGGWYLRCPFLEPWGCGIYDTRPGICLTFTAGNPECTEARARHGKGPIA
jgi:Fe-S-cluster containining protein